MKKEENIKATDITEENNNEVAEEGVKLGKRTPLYKQRSVGIKEKQGFVRRQVLEAPGRVEAFLRAGYKPVQGSDLSLRDSRVQHDSQLGSVVREVVNRRSDMTANTAIWMEIDEKTYKEDQKAKQKMNDEKSAAWNPKNMHKQNPDIYYESNLEIK